MTTDIEIHGQGFYSIVACTEAGQEWMDENVAGSVNGVANTDNTGYAENIAIGATEDDLVVVVNECLYELEPEL